MIIINTTFHIHTSIEEEILNWIKSIYAKSAIVHGAQQPSLLVKVLGHDQPMAVSYAVHLTFPNMEQAKAWNEEDGDYLRSSLTKRFGEKALTFFTYLQVID